MNFQSMPRSRRVQYPGALYHVLNRGNYRQDLFTVQRTAEAFETALFEAADRFGWRIHAYVVMPNHFHLGLETPNANLTGGMQWLQSVFANRFNRFSGEIGHVFQGRYKALVVQPGASWGRVIDYIHLNPVRAGLVSLADLSRYPRASFPKWFWRQDRRPKSLTDESWRRWGGYASGEREFRRYWADLASRREADPKLSNQLRREMCRGWMIGTAEFAAELLERLEDASVLTHQVDPKGELTPESEAVWEELTKRYLENLGHGSDDLVRAPKSAPWKLEIASRLKAETGVTNSWLAKRLHLGHPCSASRNITAWRMIAK